MSDDGNGRGAIVMGGRPKKGASDVISFRPTSGERYSSTARRQVLYTYSILFAPNSSNPIPDSQWSILYG